METWIAMAVIVRCEIRSRILLEHDLVPTEQSAVELNGELGCAQCTAGKRRPSERSLPTIDRVDCCRGKPLANRLEATR